MQPLLVLLVRHASPEPPSPGVSAAAGNDRPLTLEGRLAAKALADELRSDRITAVYSSPYRRSRETVEPIAATHGLSVQVLDDLRERRLAETSLEDAAFMDAIRRSREDPTFRLSGGESTDEARERAFAALDQIREETGHGVVVTGTHGGLISIVRWSLGVEFTIEEALSAPMPAMYPLRREREGWRAESVW